MRGDFFGSVKSELDWDSPLSEDELIIDLAGLPVTDPSEMKPAAK